MKGLGRKGSLAFEGDGEAEISEWRANNGSDRGVNLPFCSLML
jgi:hypothetical protein